MSLVCSSFCAVVEIIVSLASIIAAVGSKDQRECERVREREIE